MIKDNIYKKEHGINGISSLEKMVKTLSEKDYIVRFEKRYRIGEPGKEKQFSFQFLIEFEDKEQWILHHTTSIRDRITEQQWHSEHIKRLNEYVKKAYVVVPDELNQKEQKNASLYNEKIEENRIHSALDGVLSFGKVYQMIEDKANSLLDQGQALAKRGLHFEEKMAAAMRNEENLLRWKGSKNTSVGYLYSLFVDVMKALALEPTEVTRVDATSMIPKLPSGGLPKTDVLLDVFLSDGTKKRYPFSCKRSSARVVSVHEYSANDFSFVLNPNDEELKELLIEFQTVGGVRGMTSNHEELLTKQLSLYSEKLSRWVLGGTDGYGDSETQWAKYIITVNEAENEYKIWTIDEYIEAHRDKDQGQFGTPFQWTYPSGKKGKKIQLKMRID